MLISSASYEALGLMAGWGDCRPCGRLVRRLNSNWYLRVQEKT